MEPENEWVCQRGTSASPDCVMSAEKGSARPVIQGDFVLGAPDPWC